MKRKPVRLFRFCFIVFLVLPLSPVGGEDFTPDKASFKNAIVTVAGPDRIYIRSVTYNDKTYSILLQAADKQASTWKAVGLYDEEENLAPENLLLDFVQIHATGPNTVKISGLILEGEAYAATFEFRGPETLRLTEPLHTATMPEGFADTIGDLKGMLIDLERERYEARIGELENEISLLERRIASLQAELGDHKKKIAELTAEKADYGRQIEELKEQVAAGNEQVERLQEQKARYEKQLEQLAEETGAARDEYTRQLRRLQEENRRHEWETAILRYENTQQDVIIRSLRKERNKQEERLKDLRKNSQKLLEAKEEMEQQLTKGAAGPSEISVPIEYDAPSLRDIKNELDTILLDDFTDAIPQIGTWKITSKAAFQTDEEQYFAKLILEIAQHSKPTLFSFKARATAEGWVGFGVHIFATNKERLSGYGYGDSLLVWLTRDPEYYESEDTRLQLYRSDNDVQMELVLDAVVEEPIFRYQDIDIFYEPVEEYITIFINAEEKLVYKTWFDIEKGLEIAFRSLGGGISFMDPVVRTKE